MCDGGGCELAAPPPSHTGLPFKIVRLAAEEVSAHTYMFDRTQQAVALLREFALADLVRWYASRTARLRSGAILCRHGKVALSKQTRLTAESIRIDRYVHHRIVAVWWL